MQQPINPFWRFLTSMKLGVVLLVLFAGLSMIGTFIPQESFVPEKVEQLQPIWQTLGFTHLYNSFVYRVLVGFLTLNLLFCTYYRLPRVLDSWRHSPGNKTSAEIEGMSVHTTIPLALSLENFRKQLIEGDASRHYRWHLEQTKEGLTGWAQKNRFGVWGSFIVHLSFLILILGSIIGHFGFNGSYQSYEGATFSFKDIVLEQGQTKTEWDIRINSAREKFDARGQRENWYTDVSILQNGQEVKREALSVNHPLTYQGITFYQTSFSNGVSLLATTPQGQKTPFALQEYAQNWFQVPGTSLYLVADSIGIKNGRIVMTYQALSKESSKPIQMGVLRQGEQAKIKDLYDIVLVGPVNFTGLVIKKDPGVPVIWLGSICLILGLMLAFYVKPRKLWFVLHEEGEDQRFVVGLWSAAGREGAEELLQQFSHRFGQKSEKDSKRMVIANEEEDWIS